MDWVRFALSRWGPPVANSLCSHIPKEYASRIGTQIAHLVASQTHHPFNQTLRSNLAVVMGLREEDPKIQAALERLWGNAVRSYIDYFQASNAGDFELVRLCRLDDRVLADIHSFAERGQGLILAGIHTCSFEILMLVLGEILPGAFVLSAADLTPGRRAMNGQRLRSGVDIRPVSQASLRGAIRHLRKGGVIAMAVDIPDPDGEGLTFFNNRVNLAQGHVRLAQLAGAGIMAIAAIRTEDGEYMITGEVIPEPKDIQEKRSIRSRWAQESINYMERFVRAHPEEWMMPVPIWTQPASVRPGKWDHIAWSRAA